MVLRSVCDPSRIAIGGESAGSNLAAAICQTFREQGGPKICLQLLCVPCLDFSFSAPSHETFAYGYSLGRPLLEWTRTHYLRGDDDIVDRRASPLVCTDLEDLPAAAFFTAGYDPLRDEGRAYADRLARAGVDVEYTCYEGLPHGFVGWGKSSSRSVDYLNDCAGRFTARLSITFVVRVFGRADLVGAGRCDLTIGGIGWCENWTVGQP